MEKKELPVGERGLSYILIAISLFVIYTAYNISGKKLTSSSPGAFPLFISVLLLIFAIWIWGEKRKLSPNPYSSYREKIGALGNKVFTKDVMVVVLLLIIYCISLDIIGFPITTFAFLWLCISYLQRGNILKNLFIAALNLGIIMLIFKVVFKVILP